MRKKFKVIITDHGFKNVNQEREVVEAAGGELIETQCKTEDELIQKVSDADGLLIQLASINANVINKLKKCKIMVRYGIGYDNVDIKTAKDRGIVVCNVPDYCLDEVADHAMSMALGLARQLKVIDKRLHEGTWSLTPVSAMPSCREMTLGTIGLGRIGRRVMERARAFNFRLAAYDPYVCDELFKENKVEKLTLDELFKQSDILSIHCPLTPETKHAINMANMAKMKPSAIIINTARGGVIDTIALARALKNKTIAYAGIDVFETEPLADDHPLRECENAILTSHNAYYSEASLSMLKKMAAEEVVRGIKGDKVLNQVN